MIAVRARGEVWSTAILLYPENRDGKKGKKRRGYLVSGMCLLVLAVAISGAIRLWNTPQHRTAELNALLGDEQHRFKILPGKTICITFLPGMSRIAYGPVRPQSGKGMVILHWLLM